MEGKIGLGTGNALDLGFPAYLGSVPADSTGTEHAASLIGQGRVEASPLAMATGLRAGASPSAVVFFIASGVAGGGQLELRVLGGPTVSLGPALVSGWACYELAFDGTSVTAFVGAPVVLWVLLRQRRESSQVPT